MAWPLARRFGAASARCGLAEKLSATPARMAEDDWQPIREPGFADRVCLEVDHVVSRFNSVTRLPDGLGLRLDRRIEAAGATGVPLQRPTP